MGNMTELENKGTFYDKTFWGPGTKVCLFLHFDHVLQPKWLVRFQCACLHSTLSTVCMSTDCWDAIGLCKCKGRRHSGLIRLAFEEVMALQVWNIIWRQVVSAAEVCKTLSIDHFPRDLPTSLRFSVLWYKCSESQSQSWSRKRSILSLSLNLVLELAHLWVSVSVWNFSSASCTLKSPLVLSPLYIILETAQSMPGITIFRKRNNLGKRTSSGPSQYSILLVFRFRLDLFLNVHS